MGKDMDFTFGMHVPEKRPEMTPENCFRKGA